VNIEVSNQKINGQLTVELFEAVEGAIATLPASGTKPLAPAEELRSHEISLNALARRIRNGCEELDALIRNALRAAEEHHKKALGIALGVGHALIEAQARIAGRGSFGRWVKDNCLISLRTAELYQQLARGEEQIDAEVRRTGEMLSIRAARRLISKPAKMSEAEGAGAPEAEDVSDDPESELSPLDMLLTTTPADAMAAAFEKQDVPWLLERLPKPWIPVLTDRVAKLSHERDEPQPFIKASEVLRNALSAVAIADAPKASSVIALSQEKVALNALRVLNTLLAGAGIDEVTIIKMHAKENRCVVEKRRGGKRNGRRA
jgi:hypothetical protein